MMGLLGLIFVVLGPKDNNIALVGVLGLGVAKAGALGEGMLRAGE